MSNIPLKKDEKEVFRHREIDWQILVCAKRDVVDRYFVYLTIQESEQSFEQSFGEDDTVEHTFRRILAHVNQARQDHAMRERKALLQYNEGRHAFNC